MCNVLRDEKDKLQTGSLFVHFGRCTSGNALDVFLETISLPSSPRVHRSYGIGGIVKSCEINRMPIITAIARIMVWHRFNMRVFIS